MQRENILAMQTSLETGLRINDVLKIKRTDIVGNTLHYVAEKTGKYGTKKLPKKLIDDLFSISGSVYIFSGKRNSHTHRTRQAVWSDIKKACGKLGIDPRGVSCHSARKTYSVNTLKQYGFSRAQTELQHSRSDQTMLYVFSDILRASERNITNYRNNEIEILAEKLAEKMWEKIEKYIEMREKKRKSEKK